MIRDYKIEEKVGEGAYGTVYKVKKGQDIFILKQISLLNHTKNETDKIMSEVKILSSINSNYVVKYYDSFIEDQNLNIIMEYCEKGDLSKFIEEHESKGKLDENTILNLFIKITLGLADIHKMKILHRDLKPLNIFLKKDLDVRVGDLGIAKVLDKTFYAKTQIGTPLYISPEICQDKPYDYKSDIWALGCVLYELCTFNPPFMGDSQPAIVVKILFQNFKPIENYSPNLKNLINQILNKDARKRPTCIDILKKPFILNKAKQLGLFENIKKSFPEIINPGNNIKINDNKIASNKNINKNRNINNNKNINNKKDKINNNVAPKSNRINDNRAKDNKKNIKNNNVKKEKEKGIEIKVISDNKNKQKKDEKIKVVELLPCKERRRFNNTYDNSNQNKINDFYNDPQNTLLAPRDNITIMNTLNQNLESNIIKKEKDLNDFGMKDSIPLMGDSEYNSLINDFNDEDWEKNINIEEEKTYIKTDLDELKEKINKLKEDIKELIGEEKYKYIIEIISGGIKDDSKSEEINKKIEIFLKENCKNDNDKEKMYNIYSLYNLECQFYKKQEELKKL